MSGGILRPRGCWLIAVAPAALGVTKPGTAWECSGKRFCEYAGLILTNLVRDEFVVAAVIVAVVRH